MKNFVCLILLLCVSVFSAQAEPAEVVRASAEAKIVRDFDVRSSLATVTDWLENHKSEVYDANNVTIVKDLGDGKYRLKRSSRRGDFVWIAKETIERGEKQVVYKNILIESIQGGIIYSTTVTTVTATKSGTNIRIESSAGVNNPNVASNEMQLDMKNHLHKVEKTISRGVR